MSVSQFKEHYWYKKELIDICRKYKLPTYGTKFELNCYIISFLKGTSPAKIKPIRKNHRHGNTKVITPNTKIIESGFSLNDDARVFFAKYYNVQKFSFKKSMAIKMREIESENNTNATVLDIIEAYESKNKIPKSNNEENTYQWNNFVRDFNTDNSSKKFRNKMATASFLWNKVKDSTNEKKYNNCLLEIYQEELIKYLK